MSNPRTPTLSLPAIDLDEVPDLDDVLELLGWLTKAAMQLKMLRTLEAEQQEAHAQGRPKPKVYPTLDQRLKTPGVALALYGLKRLAKSLQPASPAKQIYSTSMLNNLLDDCVLERKGNNTVSYRDLRYYRLRQLLADRLLPEAGKAEVVDHIKDVLKGAKISLWATDSERTKELRNEINDAVDAETPSSLRPRALADKVLGAVFRASGNSKINNINQRLRAVFGELWDSKWSDSFFEKLSKGDPYVDLSHQGVAGFVFESLMGVPSDVSKRLSDTIAAAVHKESHNEQGVPTLEARLPNRLDPWTTDDVRQYIDLIGSELEHQRDSS